MTLGSSLIILSASPTCFRSEISRLRKRERIAARRPVLMLDNDEFRFLTVPFNANPWDPLLSLMTANCYCRGSDDEESRLRCKYTSVPYPSIEINFKSPPKYLAYKREMGNP